MPETTNEAAHKASNYKRFRMGSNVDIVGVTGSIPVTPTIRILYNQALTAGFGAEKPGTGCFALFPTGPLEPVEYQL